MDSLSLDGDLQQTIDVLAVALQSDPLGRYFQLDMYGLPNTKHIDVPQSKRWFQDLLWSLKPNDGAVFAHLHDAGAVSVWFPPQSAAKLPEYTPSPPSCSIAEYECVTESAKRRHMGNTPYWYLFLIGRNPSYQGPPVAARLIMPFVERAREEGAVVWLEASNMHARDAYMGLGFRVVEELRVGKYRCDETGDLVEGGRGVCVWAMQMG